MSTRLQNKVVLVTGAGGIGSQVTGSELYADGGCTAH